MRHVLRDTIIIFTILILSALLFMFGLEYVSNPNLYPIVHPVKTVAFIYYGCRMGDLSIIIPYMICVGCIAGICAGVINLFHKR